MAVTTRRSLALALAGLLLCACGAESGDELPGASDQRSGTDVAESAEPDGISVAPGTQAEAQAVVDAAERALGEGATARFAMSWLYGDLVQPVSTGAFDLSAPAFQQVYTTPEASLEHRAKAGHLWAQISGEDIADEVAGCWMHFTTGAGDRGIAAAVPPVALMLLEPSAVGFRAGSEDEIVVDLLLDEAAPATMPSAVKRLDSPIDPTATVQGVVTVRDGRYAALAFGGADVLEAFDGEDLPPELDAPDVQLELLRIKLEYSDLGEPVEVREPDASEVIEVGSQRELLSGGPDPDVELETCAANR